jgi:acyl carrier protein
LEREFGLEARADHLREIKTLEALVAFVQARAA